MFWGLHGILSYVYWFLKPSCLPLTPILELVQIADYLNTYHSLIFLYSGGRLHSFTHVLGATWDSVVCILVSCLPLTPILELVQIADYLNTYHSLIFHLVWIGFLHKNSRLGLHEIPRLALGVYCGELLVATNGVNL